MGRPLPAPVDDPDDEQKRLDQARIDRRAVLRARLIAQGKQLAAKARAGASEPSS